MPIRKLLVILIPMVVAASGAAFFLAGSPPEPVEPRQTPKPVATKPPAAAIPHREEIMAQTQQPPTDEELEEETRLDAEQVLDAAQSLKDPDPEKRIEGIEQLGAYPTPESEEQLMVSLRGDPSAEVRSAAADALGNFDRLGEPALSTLFEALKDRSEDVQASALDTLQAQIEESPAGSKQYRKLLGILKKMAGDKTLGEETRRSIREFLQDQAEPE
jgi:HEAT repeat protein